MEIDNPVRLPPGRPRLRMSPEPRGSPATKTIGIVVVAFFAARAVASALAPPLLKRKILAIDPTVLAQPLAECLEEMLWPRS